MKLWEVNVFTAVCHSDRGGGLYGYAWSHVQGVGIPEGVGGYSRGAGIPEGGGGGEYVCPPPGHGT